MQVTIVTNFWERDTPIHVELSHKSVGLLTDLGVSGNKLWGIVVVRENWHLGALIRDLLVSVSIDPGAMCLLSVTLLKQASVTTRPVGAAYL